MHTSTPNDSVGTPANPRSLLRMSAVMERVGLKRATIYRLIAQGEFPSQVRVLPGHRGSRWDSHAIDRWIAERVEASKDQAA